MKKALYPVLFIYFSWTNAQILTSEVKVEPTGNIEILLQYLGIWA
ncbi:hypothetical protein [Marinoscillum sp.]